MERIIRVETRVETEQRRTGAGLIRALETACVRGGYTGVRWSEIYRSRGQVLIERERALVVFGFKIPLPPLHEFVSKPQVTRL